MYCLFSWRAISRSSKSHLDAVQGNWDIGDTFFAPGKFMYLWPFKINQLQLKIWRLFYFLSIFLGCPSFRSISACEAHTLFAIWKRIIWKNYLIIFDNYCLEIMQSIPSKKFTNPPRKEILKLPVFLLILFPLSPKIHEKIIRRVIFKKFGRKPKTIIIKIYNCRNRLCWHS